MARFVAFLIELVAFLLTVAAVHDGWRWHVEPTFALVAPPHATVAALLILVGLARLSMPRAGELIMEEVFQKADPHDYNLTLLASALTRLLVVLVLWGLLWGVS